jgi:hypothetical protein
MEKIWSRGGKENAVFPWPGPEIQLVLNSLKIFLSGGPIERDVLANLQS